MKASDLPIDKETKHYLQALEAQPVDICRASVSACRSSGLRREVFRQTIVDGNRLGTFRLPGGATFLVPLLQLLRDMPTRWSSTYNMIKRYLELFPAIVEYAFRIRNDAQIPLVLHKQYEVLQDIVEVLTIAHNAQELLSAKKTPMLALAFPVYTAVIEAWEQLSVAIPELSHAITQGILKIQEYVNRTQNARVHSLAMVVNPSFKLEWISNHWTSPQATQAEENVKA
ncbi:hypothetical protein BDV93DRAFT_456541 [Ceratobasidium sp. AG-I]|nr:hypothetical protein BDV93DRAFT_456541 [Ceratobasidium sp. AG-I]